MTVKTRVPLDSVSRQSESSKLTDVVIGVLLGVDDAGIPLVVYPGNESSVGIPARVTVSMSADDVGREVALLFENGDPSRPLVIGRIQNPSNQTTEESVSIKASVDDERIEFNAKQEIVLRCGKASITLTKAGKILIRGAYLLSRSSGANRIKGGSIQLN